MVKQLNKFVFKFIVLGAAPNHLHNAFFPIKKHYIIISTHICKLLRKRLQIQRCAKYHLSPFAESFPTSYCTFQVFLRSWGGGLPGAPPPWALRHEKTVGSTGLTISQKRRWWTVQSGVNCYVGPSSMQWYIDDSDGTYPTMEFEKLSSLN